MLQYLRQQACRELLAESRKHAITIKLRQIPPLGPIRSALAVALIHTRFTQVMACRLAESPCDPLHRRLRQLRCLRCRFECFYRVERSSSRAGVSPAEVQRLSRRTFSPTDSIGQNYPMNTQRIEEAILSTVGDRWKKVAMVIAKVADAMGTELPNGDERYELISDRIEVLVRAGRLEMQGNTKNWHFSEVRQKFV
jgi:hypothetical protein